MSILQECPKCRKKQKISNKKCKCGQNLDKSKKAKKVKYWVNYRLPGGQQKRVSAGYSISDARAADGKIKGQKKEGKLFDIRNNKLTFLELTEWYVNLKTVKKLASYKRILITLNNFNDVFGHTPINSILPIDLENYQLKREDDGRAPATIDMEISVTKTMVTKAFDNDKVGGHAVKVFRTPERKLKKGSNARSRTITFDEYIRLIDISPRHLQAVIITALNTGMRLGELRTLRWSYIDQDAMMIRLPEEVTKEGRKKNIPINHHVKTVLDKLPRNINHDFVFTYRTVPIQHKNGLKSSFRTACGKADIVYGRDKKNGLIFHDIRRSTKTYMLNAKVDRTYRDLILGHALPGMDAHYIKPKDKDITKAMAKYTKWFDAQLEVFFENVDKTVDRKEKALS